MEVDDLTDEQSQALSRFREFTHIDSVETCRQYLAAHEWDVERAVETALISDIDAPTTTHENERFTTDYTPSAPPTPDEPIIDEQMRQRYEPNIAMNEQRSENPILWILRIPFAFLYAFFVRIQPFLPWGILRFLVSFVQSLFWNPEPINPTAELEAYCTEFDNQFGRNHPAFYRGRFAQALRDAQREVRLLFIYLHDKNSPRCDRFCQEVLCSEALRSTIGSNLLWSASRDTQEGIQASRLLNAYSFPCFCIVAHRGSQQIVQLKLDRYTNADEFLAEIIHAVQQADQTLQYNREQQDSRNSRDRLLEEQNAAYQDSVRADQEKAAQRAREADERRKVEEAEQRIREEQERKLQAFAKYRNNLRETFPPEPAPTEPDTIQVSIRLPAHEPIRRRFYRSDFAKLLFEFAWTDSNVPDQFELLWGYPRRRYQYEHIGDQLIRDVMTGSTETCYLEQVDEETTTTSSN